MCLVESSGGLIQEQRPTLASVSASAAAACGANEAASARRLSALPCNACMKALKDVGLSMATGTLDFESACAERRAQRRPGTSV